MTLWHSVIMKEPILVLHIQLHTTFGLYSFSLIYPCSMKPSRMPHDIQSCLLMFLWAVTILRLSLVLMTLIVLRSPGQIICRMFSIEVFLWLDWGLEDHRDKVPFSSHHIKGTCYQYSLSLLMFTLTIWASEVIFDRFLGCEFPFFPLSMLCLFSGKFLNATPTQWMVS